MGPNTQSQNGDCNNMNSHVHGKCPVLLNLHIYQPGSMGSLHLNPGIPNYGLQNLA